jgi:hypothetical protein
VTMKVEEVIKLVMELFPGSKVIKNSIKRRSRDTLQQSLKGLFDDETTKAAGPPLSRLAGAGAYDEGRERGEVIEDGYG